MKIKKGDTVLIISGKDKNKKGKVLQVFPSQNRILVEGVNKKIRHVKPKRTGEKGQRVEIYLPIDASNALVICPKCGKPTRIGFKKLNEKKLRRCKKCQGTF